MNKTDVHPAALTTSPASFPDLQLARRLIVLVPESLTDSVEVARKIWKLAKTLDGPVQLIGLCKDVVHESSLRRQLVFLSVMVGDSFVPVETKIEFGGNWLKVVKSNWHDGDVIVCFDGQYAGLTRKPLGQLIESNLKLNVYVLDGGNQARHALPVWLSSVIAWTGSLSIMAIFFWLQVRITQLPEAWAENALMYLSIPIEVGLIWGWNTLFP